MSDVAFEVNANTPDIRFLASLSDGRTVVEDVAEGVRARHAWIRLSRFLKENPTLSITGLKLQRPNGPEIIMPSNQQGYFIGKKQRKVFPGGESEYLGIGFYDGSVVSCSYYKLPNFDHQFTEDKSKAKAGFMLITNEQRDGR